MNRTLICIHSLVFIGRGGALSHAYPVAQRHGNYAINVRICAGLDVSKMNGITLAYRLITSALIGTGTFDVYRILFRSCRDAYGTLDSMEPPVKRMVEPIQPLIP